MDSFRWNKKLNYIIAIANDGVYDVTKRYTRKWHEVTTSVVFCPFKALPAAIFFSFHFSSS